MKKVKLISLLLLPGIIITSHSCGESTREEAKRSAETEPKTQTEVEETVEKSEYLLENKTLHTFSDPAAKDEFRIVVTGESLLKGKVLFTITNPEGKNLLKEEFEANFLLGYDFTGNIHSQKDTDAFITKRIKTFFEEKQFSSPAIEDDVIFEDQSYYIAKEIWDEIKANKQSVGFYYLLGKEDGRRVAFSKKKGRAVMYYNCC